MDCDGAANWPPTSHIPGIVSNLYYQQTAFRPANARYIAHTRILPSAAPAASQRPSGEKAQP